MQFAQRPKQPSEITIAAGRKFQRHQNLTSAVTDCLVCTLKADLGGSALRPYGRTDLWQPQRESNITR
jgi:hypothetical protein